MLDLWKTTTVNQFEAAVSTLSKCVAECPDTAWDAPIANLKFCQVVFHTLFFTDCYLGQNVDELRKQAFHRERTEYFRDYEELEPRRQTLLYDRPTTILYMAHCRRRVSEVVMGETAESLAAKSGFAWFPFSRAELYPYSLRHIQHHAAQLSLRLRLDTGTDVPWAKSGWRG